MNIEISENSEEAGEIAARKAEELLKNAIAENGRATFIAATGASQFDFLETLAASQSVDWSKTTMFHLDEYIGISASHPASFRRYLKERLIDRVNPGEVYLIQGDKDPATECKRLNTIISGYSVDAAFVGIGENGHLAFNDPPADFETEYPYIIVDLDEMCRKQQFGEGWFKSLEDVPKQAISMSVKQIMKSSAVVCTVPDSRKAKAVKNCFDGDVSPMFPASILKEHQRAFTYLDKYSSALLKPFKKKKIK